MVLSPLVVPTERVLDIIIQYYIGLCTTALQYNIIEISDLRNVQQPLYLRLLHVP